MNKKLNKAIIKATKETFEAVMGHPIKSYAPVAGKLNGLTLDTRIIVKFTGNLSGSIALRCSKDIACGLASKMMGIDVAPGSLEMKDAIGELLNMIIGASTSYMRLFDAEFKLSVPMTVIGDDTADDASGAEDLEVSHIPFSYKGHELSMDVVLN